MIPALSYFLMPSIMTLVRCLSEYCSQEGLEEITSKFWKKDFFGDIYLDKDIGQAE